jgi:hypothetical protein
VQISWSAGNTSEPDVCRTLLILDSTAELGYIFALILPGGRGGKYCQTQTLGFASAKMRVFVFFGGGRIKHPLSKLRGICHARERGHPGFGFPPEACGNDDASVGVLNPMENK